MFNTDEKEIDGENKDNQDDEANQGGQPGDEAQRMFRQQEEDPDQGDYEEPEESDDMNQREMMWNTTEVPPEDEPYEKEVSGEQIESFWSMLEDDARKKITPNGSYYDSSKYRCRRNRSNIAQEE